MADMLCSYMCAMGSCSNNTANHSRAEVLFMKQICLHTMQCLQWALCNQLHNAGCLGTKPGKVPLW